MSKKSSKMGIRRGKAGLQRHFVMPLFIVVSIMLSLYLMFRLPGSNMVEKGEQSYISMEKIYPNAELVKLLVAQNRTIVELQSRVNTLLPPAHSAGESLLSTQLIHANNELGRMRQKLLELTERVAILPTDHSSHEKHIECVEGASHKRLNSGSNTPTSVSGEPLMDAPNLLRTSLDRECEARFGLGLVDRWRAAEEEWCSSAKNQSKIKSQPHEDSFIKCYPYAQVHKKKHTAGRRSAIDLFCEAKNILIDFTKVYGKHGHMKPHLGDQYHTFGAGATISTCTPTEKFGRVAFMPHMHLQMGGRGTFRHSATSIPRSHVVAKGSTYLLSRDEDCENMFHSSADHLNLYLVSRILRLDLKNLQVVLFDKHVDGPFFDYIQTAFSPRNPLRRAEHYLAEQQGKGAAGVLFEHLIWHLESPAGIVFPKVRLDVGSSIE